MVLMPKMEDLDRISTKNEIWLTTMDEETEKKKEKKEKYVDGTDYFGN